jgi:hypothetical protein
MAHYMLLCKERRLNTAISFKFNNFEVRFKTQGKRPEKLFWMIKSANSYSTNTLPSVNCGIFKGNILLATVQ